MCEIMSVDLAIFINALKSIIVIDSTSILSATNGEMRPVCLTCSFSNLCMHSCLILLRDCDTSHVQCVHLLLHAIPYSEKNWPALNLQKMAKRRHLVIY